MQKKKTGVQTAHLQCLKRFDPSRFLTLIKEPILIHYTLVIKDVLSRKMVFVGGPRQVGKTTMSLQFLNPSTPNNSQYLNWDRAADRKLILNDQIPLQKKVTVLDEIHKYKNWRNLMKGLYDKYHEDHQFIVTG